MSGPADTYSGFAAHYDLHGWDWFARVYGPRIRSLLEERGMRSSRILDAGCGTGALAIDLAAAGHEVTGVDLSEGMIAVARRKDARGAVAWRQADITSMDLGEASRPFDLVTCVADILNHLESLDAWEAGFGDPERMWPSGDDPEAGDRLIVLATRR
jgi:2-polyprenyl-3-methyl-5-hydroxy-6-metoxy-1,4-benzoquinol methylase